MQEQNWVYPAVKPQIQAADNRSSCMSTQQNPEKLGKSTENKKKIHLQNARSRRKSKNPHAESSISPIIKDSIVIIIIIIIIVAIIAAFIFILILITLQSIIIQTKQRVLNRMSQSSVKL
jgi:hypothetical protein